DELDRFRAELGAGCSADYAASRGEYFNGLLVAALLQATFVDPAQYILIRDNGTVDPVSYQRLGERLADLGQRYVVPGFYGADGQGQIKTFSRGGSDITGAIAARAA